MQLRRTIKQIKLRRLHKSKQFVRRDEEESKVLEATSISKKIFECKAKIECEQTFNEKVVFEKKLLLIASSS